MKYLLALFALAAQPALAGDGGHTNYSCLSSSGRTMLSIFQDNYSASEVPYKVRLIVDGEMAEYYSVSNESPNIQMNWNTGVLKVVDGGRNVLTLKIQSNLRATQKVVVKAGYQDPRKDSDRYGDNTKDIELSCRVFFQGP